jgi:hypothetical protein
LDGGEDRFTDALTTAHNEILFRLGVFDERSYLERAPFGGTKYSAALALATQAEWMRAGAILYTQMAEIELQFGESGTPSATPDGFDKGAFTPEKNVQAMEYRRRATELQSEYEMILAVILPNSNLPFFALAGGRSDFTDNGEYFGRDNPWT